MAGPEATIERWVEAEARRYGVESAKWGKDGWPDRVFFIPGGKPLLIEFKAPGEPPSPRQQYRIGCLIRLGYMVQVHDNRESAMDAILYQLKTYTMGMGHNG